MEPPGVSYLLPELDNVLLHSIVGYAARKSSYESVRVNIPVKWGCNNSHPMCPLERYIAPSRRWVRQEFERVALYCELFVFFLGPLKLKLRRILYNLGQAEIVV
jgi:hypothetical protein